MLEVFQMLNQEQIITIRKAKVQEIYFEEFFKHVGSTLLEVRSFINNLRDADDLRKILFFKNDREMCIFHSPGEGIFLRTLCEKHEKEMLFGLTNNNAAVKKLTKQFQFDQRIDGTKQDRHKWIGYKDEELHFEILNKEELEP